MMRPRKSAWLAAVWLLVAGCSREPASYDDCILLSLKAGMDKTIAMELVEACERKFPKNATPSAPLVDLPNEAFKELSGQFDVGLLGNGSVYNGNEKWRVEEVTIAIAEHGGLTSMEKASAPRSPKRVERYRITILVDPLSSASFRVPVNWRQSDEYEWAIVGARGSEVK